MTRHRNLRTLRNLRALAIAGIFMVAPCMAEPAVPDALKPDIDLYALMSGKCSTLRIRGHDFACKAVAFFHSEKGRANFTVALDDPSDRSHIISFSGENGQRTKDNLYELAIDRMLLNSQERPKVDGLPTPMVEPSAGVCRQIGNFAARFVSSIWCSATDETGNKYEFRFESDGSPITLRRVIQSAPTIGGDPYR